MDDLYYLYKSGRFVRRTKNGFFVTFPVDGEFRKTRVNFLSRALSFISKTPNLIKLMYPLKDIYE